MNNRFDRKPPFDGHDADAFVSGVLGRTSGSACGRALDQLEALLDDELAGLDRQLVQAHLEHCRGCRETAVALGWLAPLLPQMAEIDPGPAFLAGVLDRTSRSHAPRSIAEHPDGLAGLVDRVGRWWEKQILRPAFATQAAYAATVLAVLLTMAPGSPLRGAPERVFEVAKAGPVAVPILGPALFGATDRLETELADLAAAGRGGAAARRDELSGAIGARNSRSAQQRGAFTTHLQAVGDRARDGELTEAGYEFLAALRSGRDAWSAWWNTSEIDNRTGP